MQKGMRFVQKSLLLLAAFVCAQAGRGQGGSSLYKNFLFDVVADKNKVLQNQYSNLSIADAYNRAKDFGWIKAPQTSFDTANRKLKQLFLHDGAVSTDTIVFRLDLPNGDYFMLLTLGAPDSSRQTVLINDVLLPDTIATPWYRLSYKTLCKKIRVSEGKVIVKINPLRGAKVGVYAIEFRAVTQQERIPFSTELEQDTTAINRFAERLAKRVEKDANDIAAINQLQTVSNYLLACRYYNGGGWSWAVKQTGLSLIYRMYAAADLLEPIVEDKENLLYDKALFLLAKIYYWLDQEDDDLYHSDRFQIYFTSLKTKYPDNPLIRMYLGEKIFDSLQTEAHPANAPRWAVYQREAMMRMRKVIHWWVKEKQAANGEMGGKYGDDVELLRWWLPAILGADDSLAKQGYTRLADGVWNSDALERGFAKQIDDVEHSAELFRDTHPAMFLMNYGDPEYVERCLVSMQNFRDVWTGRTSLGHLHFKSYYLSATETKATPPDDVDVALNARAVHPGLWLAWYNHNPTLLKLFTDWCNSWIADAARTDNGKPYGLLPSAIAFSNEGIGGYSTEWYNPHLSYSYYQWDHLGHVGELMNHMLGMYGITGNESFLKPLNRCTALMKGANTSQQDNPKKAGSLAWAKTILINGGVDHSKSEHPFGKLFGLAKSLTQKPVYDSLIVKYGTVYSRYQLTHDKTKVYKGFDELLDHLRYNFPLLTSEVKFTDRVYVPGSDLVMGMYTGHFGAGYEYPSLVATWKNTGTDVAIFVRRGDRKSATISLYNFGKEKTVQLQTWQLEPGLYTLRQGIDRNDDNAMDEQISKRRIELRERMNTIPIRLAPGKETLLTLEQVKAFGAPPVNLPDLAINRRDIQPSNDKTSTGAYTVSCRIHNIGSAAVQNATVELYVDEQKAGEKIIVSLAAPLDLNPRTTTVQFSCLLKPGQHTIRIKAASDQQEITLQNNEAVYVLTAE